MPQNIQEEVLFSAKIEASPTHRESFVKNIIDLADFKENSLLLDAGCGDGFWSRAFSKKGHRTVGIDLSENLLEKARNLANEGQKYVRANLLQEIPCKTPLDGVICSGLLHHLPPEDINRLLINLRKCLKVGGKIVIIEPNGANPIVKTSRLIGSVLQKLSPEIASPNETVYSPKKLQSYLKTSGFDTLSLKTYRNDPIGSRISPFIDILLKLRKLMFDLSWTTLPKYYRGNEVVILCTKND